MVFCDDALKFGEATRRRWGRRPILVKRAAAANQFKGKSGSTLDIPAPEGIKADRLIVVGVGKASDIKEKDFLKFGGVTAGKLNAASESVTVIAELPEAAMQGDAAAAIASGIRLRAYKFDRYKTKKKDGENGALRADVSIAVGDVAAARKAFAPATPCRGRRGDRARTRQRAAERAVSGGVRAPRQRSCGSSASRSRCSTSRR